LRNACAIVQHRRRINDYLCPFWQTVTQHFGFDPVIVANADRSKLRNPVNDVTRPVIITKIATPAAMTIPMAAACL